MEALRVVLHGGSYTSRPQKAVFDFICADKTAPPTLSWTFNGTHAFEWSSEHACGKVVVPATPPPSTSEPPSPTAPGDDGDTEDPPSDPESPDQEHGDTNGPAPSPSHPPPPPVVDWPAWGPRACLWIDGDALAIRWITVTCGQRLVAIRNTPPAPLQVYDFNARAVRRRLATTLTVSSSSDAKSAGQEGQEGEGEQGDAESDIEGDMEEDADSDTDSDIRTVLDLSMSSGGVLESIRDRDGVRQALLARAEGKSVTRYCSIPHLDIFSSVYVGRHW